MLLSRLVGRSYPLDTPRGPESSQPGSLRASLIQVFEGEIAPVYRWQPGQKKLDRWPMTTLRMPRPQTGQASPSRP